MDFAYGEDLELIRQSAREYADSALRPHAAGWDEREEFPGEVIEKLGELGFMGVIFPEDLGGGGLSYADYAIVIEELARADASVGINRFGASAPGSTVMEKLGISAANVVEQAKTLLGS